MRRICICPSHNLLREQLACVEIQIPATQFVGLLSLLWCEFGREVHVQHRASLGEDTPFPQSGGCQSRSARDDRRDLLPQTDECRQSWIAYSFPPNIGYKKMRGAECFFKFTKMAWPSTAGAIAAWAKLRKSCKRPGAAARSLRWMPQTAPYGATPARNAAGQQQTFVPKRKSDL